MGFICYCFRLLQEKKSNTLLDYSLEMEEVCKCETAKVSAFSMRSQILKI